MEKNEIVCVDNASWDVRLNVTCPHCEHYFNLTDYISMSELPKIQSYKDLNFDVDCPECSKEFRIINITY